MREALTGRDDFVSAQGLHSALHASGSPIGLATVYRALADLAVEGEADGGDERAGHDGPGHDHAARDSDDARLD